VLRPKSETAAQASTGPHQLVIEWITQLWPSRSRAPSRGSCATRWAARRQPARSPFRHGEEPHQFSGRPAHLPRADVPSTAPGSELEAPGSAEERTSM